MRTLGLMIVLSLIFSACTPHQSRRRHGGHGPGFSDDTEDQFEIDKEEKVRGIPLSEQKRIQVPRVLPKGETWIPRTLSTRNLDASWSADHRKVFLKGSVQWNLSSANSSGDISFTLMGVWDGDKGVADLVLVKNSSDASAQQANVRGRLFCLSADDQGRCDSAMVEIFVRDHGMVLSGQFPWQSEVRKKQLEKEAHEPPTPSELPPGSKQEINDEVEGFDLDLEIVGSSEEELDQLYERQEVETTEEEVPSPPFHPGPSSPVQQDANPLFKSLPDVPESEEMKGIGEELERAIQKPQSVKEAPVNPESAPSNPYLVEDSGKVDPISPALRKAFDLQLQDISPNSPKAQEQGKAAEPTATPEQTKTAAPLEKSTSEDREEKGGSSLFATLKEKALKLYTEFTDKDTAPPATVPQPVATPSSDGVSRTDAKKVVSPVVENPLSAGDEQAKASEETSQDSNKQTRLKLKQLLLANEDARYADQSIGGHSKDGRLQKATNLIEIVSQLGDRARLRVAYPNQKRHFGNHSSVELLVKSSVLLDRMVPGFFLEVGDISAEKGGRLAPHKSHQNGLDIDVGFFRKEVKEGYYGKTVVTGGRASESFDRALQWKYFKSLMTYYHDRIYFILVHPAVKEAMCLEAVRSGDLVTGKDVDPIVSHTLRRLVGERSHDDHFHVRMRCPLKDKRCVQTTRDLAMTMGCTKKKRSS